MTDEQLAREYNFGLAIFMHVALSCLQTEPESRQTQSSLSTLLAVVWDKARTDRGCLFKWRRLLSLSKRFSQLHSNILRNAYAPDKYRPKPPDQAVRKKKTCVCFKTSLSHHKEVSERGLCCCYYHLLIYMQSEIEGLAWLN